MDADDFHWLLGEQRSELMAAQSAESDLDLAFDLQLQEAITASLALHTSSPQPSPSRNDTVFSLADKELSRFQRELSDREVSAREMRKTREELDRRIHDQNFAREIARIPEHDWQDWGDNYEKPFGEGCSSNKNAQGERDDGVLYRLYFKGLFSEEKVYCKKTLLAGIGIAICDSRDNLIFELRKPLIVNGTGRQTAEFKALIEGLNAALALELKHVTFYCHYYPLYQFVTGRWAPKQRKIAMLLNQVSLLRRKFMFCDPTLVACNEVKFVFELAREAMVSQINNHAEAEPSQGKALKEKCVICLEDYDAGRMFSVDGCLHRYCFSCMKQHVEVKLHHGMVPKCPHEGCKSELTVDSCKTFLTTKLIEILDQRRKEASIPVSEKVYCPYPRCSALMSKGEILEYAKNVLGGADRSGARKCMKCHGLFCINCKVPWHSNMTCNNYKRLNPNPPTEDVKLKSLAKMKLWRQCVKCEHMIELSEGCYHITCRCGYEFCYNCGAERKNKQATCSCPSWDEDHIWYMDNGDSDDDEDDFDEYGSYDSDSDWY